MIIYNEYLFESNNKSMIMNITFLTEFIESNTQQTVNI